jgi:uncharacterized membrane protein YadS
MHTATKAKIVRIALLATVVLAVAAASPAAADGNAPNGPLDDCFDTINDILF